MELARRWPIKQRTVARKVVGGYSASGPSDILAGRPARNSMISPNWRGLWGGETPATLPADYDDPQVQKAIVLLTDGDNSFTDTIKTAYGTAGDYGGTTTSRNAAGCGFMAPIASDTRTRSKCPSRPNLASRPSNQLVRWFERIHTGTHARHAGSASVTRPGR